MSSDSSPSICEEESVASFESSPAKRFECDKCERKFTRRYTLKRHIDSKHDVSSEEEEEESKSCDESEVEDDASNSENESEQEEESNSCDESEMEDDASNSGDENEQEEYDETSEDSSDEDRQYVTPIFRKIVCKTVKLHEDMLSEIIEEDEEMESSGKSKKKIKQATIKAIESSNAAKKTLRNLFAKNLINVYKERNHPLYKAIVKKARQLMDDEGFEFEEGVKAAVSYRKHAIYDLLKYI